MSARRRRWPVVVAAVAMVGLAAGGLAVYLSGGSPAPLNRCLVTARGGTYSLDPVQAQLAATIAAIGKRRGLPNHAVTIAYATALQESGLRNLGGGHLDSLGLFQQRPSQGWGTVAQISDPRYAATRFYAALEQVPRWNSLPVTVAAQRVQRSAVPDGYAKFETQARVMASAFTGEVPAGLTCDLEAPSSAGGTVNESLLRASIQTELGAGALGVPPTPERGWTVANWLVAHAFSSGVTSVRYADRTWQRDKHVWLPSAPVASVSFTLSR